MERKLFGAGALALALSLTSASASAALSDDLAALVPEAQALDASLGAAAFAPLESCLDVGAVGTSVRDYVRTLDAVLASISPPTQPTAADLDNLAALSALALSMGAEAQLISEQLMTVSGAYDLFEVKAMLSATLSLSRDIGVMADRIGEMANRILAMADNIGTMADRILVTQRIQSANLAATQAALLTTQLNLVALTSSASTIAYNLSLGLLKSDSLLLSQQMGGTTLTASNMGDELRALSVAASALTARAALLYGQVAAVSAGASALVDGETLALVADLAPLHAALAAALDGFAGAVAQLAPVTETAVLADATAAVLQLAQDIGAMSDRIVEMNDRIIVMADNVGLMADRIVETQDIQQTNLALTQASLRAAQDVTLSVVQTWGL